jgi:hypothetical protein
MQVIPPATDPDSNVNILHYMKNNIPFSLVVVLSMLNQYVFEDMDCTTENETAAITTYSALTVFDIVWTVQYCRVDFLHNYPHRSWIKYATIRACTSVQLFYS